MNSALRFLLPVCLAASLMHDLPAAETDRFAATVAPILEQHCVKCHRGATAEGGLDLSTRQGLLTGGESGIAAITPGKPNESYLLDLIVGDTPEMPKTGDPLSANQVAVLRAWIADGAQWPDGRTLEAKAAPWWSLAPLNRPELPQLSKSDQAWVKSPIDAFILAKLRELQLSPAPPADRRTLIRRIYHDLTGLPPTPQQVADFIADPDPLAYEKLVDPLLDSPQYGERWARHWLDVVHYGDTHGYDKDKVRPHAWPYRDYVIRAFNDDKPYERFIREQLAGDWFYPGTRDGIVALGFIAAGPFDFVGQIEVGDGTMEKQRVRNVDRDDMVASTMNTFSSLTAQCARCHNHKFDPITQEDYYSLQAVFAAVDRADRPYDVDPDTARQRLALRERQDEFATQQAALERRILEMAGPQLADIDKQIAALNQTSDAAERPEYGYHSGIVASADIPKWVQVDLGQPMPIAHIAYVACKDDFAGIGTGFGFPRRYKIEISNDPEFQTDVTTVEDRTDLDVANPGVTPQSVTVGGKSARYVRITATKLALRQNDYIFALAELSVLTPEGRNAAAGATVTALDSIEAPVRWGQANLVDGHYVGAGDGNHLGKIIALNDQRRTLLERAVDEPTRQRQASLKEEITRTTAELAALPPKEMVYAAATDFVSMGSFHGTGGTPRAVHVLARGNEASPLYEVGPGTVGCIDGLAARFDVVGQGHVEAERRAALAEWIVNRDNPLTWRSIVNRVWYYHFGRGIVESLNDFGRMGSQPTHPELLDWLAVEFRDGGQSLKDLHRLIVTSATYRQSSGMDRDADMLAAHGQAESGERPDPQEVDASNLYLWRMNRQRLEAEAIRDGVLAVSGLLDRTMYGPGFRDFGFVDDHSPHYKYQEYNPDDAATHRRAIYRLVVRSAPNPLMETLDCADPSLNVARRNETLTALQALTLLNNTFIVRMAEHFAARVETMGDTPAARINAAYRLALCRDATDEELQTLVPIAKQHGLANVCRLIFNTNEFVFVD